jgi:hypothetical protein
VVTAGSVDGTTVLTFTQPFYDPNGLPAPPAAGDVAMPGCPSYDQLAAICAAFFLNIPIGGSYYQASLLGALAQRTEVLNATSATGDVNVIVDQQTIQKIKLGTLTLQAA